jgi:uncharacterized protein YutE (UPF0331/DUF86 family)
MHIVSEKKLGLPKSSRDAFRLLESSEIINNKLAGSLMNLVGFRNIAVHDYQNINLSILQAIIERHLQDFKEFNKVIIGLK